MWEYFKSQKVRKCQCARKAKGIFQTVCRSLVSIIVLIPRSTFRTFLLQYFRPFLIFWHLNVYILFSDENSYYGKNSQSSSEKKLRFEQKKLYLLHFPFFFITIFNQNNLPKNGWNTKCNTLGKNIFF